MKFCRIIYEDKIYNLYEFYQFYEFYGYKVSIFSIPSYGLFEIKLKGIKNIKDASQMFEDCSTLVSIPDISKWNTSNVKYMNRMFLNCSSLKSLPDISK